MVLDTFYSKTTQVILTLQKMDTTPNTRSNVADETRNSHVNIDDKEIELLIIPATETLKTKSATKMRFLR